MILFLSLSGAGLGGFRTTYLTTGAAALRVYFGFSGSELSQFSGLVSREIASSSKN